MCLVKLATSVLMVNRNSKDICKKGYIAEKDVDGWRPFNEHIEVCPQQNALKIVVKVNLYNAHCGCVGGSEDMG